METNRFEENSERERVLSQAVEILRKRVDRLGVAEPMIQPEGENHILVAIPGLSESENDSARKSVQRAAVLEFRMVHPDSDEYVSQGIPAPGYELKRLPSKAGDPEGGKVLLVKKTPERGLDRQVCETGQRESASGDQRTRNPFPPER